MEQVDRPRTRGQLAVVIEHPHPTVGTVKQLYAHALHCAYPECREGLYRKDEVSGVLTLNSRICHICARSEGGPRWDADQSPEANRSEENLVLMCVVHASAIDDARLLSSYPASLLRQWKAAQLDEHRLGREGWQLNDTMAESALTASFSNVALAINNSTLNLGGGGGNAPGAGGGGGGAVGPGARGGRGGGGGRVTDGNGNPLSEDPLAEFLATMAEVGWEGERPPGSGGGGGAAFGPGAIGGDGGDGGDGLMATLPLEAGDQVQVEVGAAGLPPRVPGQHMPPGGDSVITIRSASGELKHVLRARAGASARAGTLPDDWATISDSDLQNGFQVSALMPVNSLELRDGLVFVLGGGWSRYSVTTLPVDVVWPILCVSTWRELAEDVTRGLQLRLSDPEGVEVSRIAIGISPDVASSRSHK